MLSLGLPKLVKCPRPRDILSSTLKVSNNLALVSNVLHTLDDVIFSLGQVTFEHGLVHAR